MKYLSFFFFIVMISSCCSTKLVAESNPKKEEVTKIEEVTDSIVEVAQVSIEQPELKEETKPEKSLEENDGFHQVLTKRTLTLHQLWDELLQNHVAENGNVNYMSFKTEHAKLLGYIRILNSVYSDDNFKTLSKEEKLAFWINAYNAMTIDLILRHYPVKSIKDIKNPWKQRHWKLGNKWYNLDEIEHQILRKMDEPRIHFAIVCASVSCPKLQNEAFTSSKLNEQLTKVTKEFLSDKTKNDLSEDPLKLSKIFKWFIKDFKQNNNTLTNFLNKYSEETIYSHYKKTYLDYNWNLNE